MAAGYKWLLCPYGSGLMYVAPRHHDCMPLEENWAGRQGAENFSELVPYKDVYQPGARRFDVGERSNFTAVAQMVAALEQLSLWRVARIAERLQVVTEQLADRCAAAGLAQSASIQAPHMIGFPLPPNAPSNLAARMATQRVHLSRRGDWLRLSPHLHVEASDIARFGEVLDRHLRQP
jgi:selenocysteine lyase/cysteine desulfurase